MNVSIKVELFESNNDREPIYSSEPIQTTVEEDKETNVYVPVKHLAKISNALIIITYPNPSENDRRTQEYGLTLVQNVFSCIKSQESDHAHRFFPWWFFFASPAEEASRCSGLPPGWCFSTSYSKVVCAEQVCATISKQDDAKCLLCFGDTKKHCQETTELMKEFNEPFCLEIILNPLDQLENKK